MELKGFPVLGDENIQSEVVSYLRNEGFEVKYVNEEGLEGEPDQKLLEMAKAENRVVITHDSDFGRLIFTQKIDFVGVIYLRPGHFDPYFTINTWKALLKADLGLKPPFIIVAENNGERVKIRYRQL
ncbi:MAG: DUF5615 family PIN-like protein [Phaeodactylibacter sp.]|nr:DUF5615 family PIN-like protein [Phaeodactylibacter sp.]